MNSVGYDIKHALCAIMDDFISRVSFTASYLDLEGREAVFKGEQEGSEVIFSVAF
jgi:hypothetical protein